MHFVKTNKINKETAKIYNLLFNKRHDSDYVDFVKFDSETVEPWISETKKFINEIKKLLNY